MWRPGDPWMAAAGAALAAGVLVAAFFLPWLATPDGDHLDRGALATSTVPYERALVWWPTVALPVAALTLLALAFVRAWPPWATPARGAAWVVVASCAFVVLLTGTRWVGFQVARSLDPGPPLVHLHIVPYLHLAAGAVLLGITAWGCHMAGAVRRGLASLAAAATLLLLPLVPLGTSRGFHFDELTLAVHGTIEGPLEPIARDLAWARIGLWIAAVAWPLAAAVAPWLGTSWRRWAPLAALPGLVLASFFAVGFHLKWMGVGGLSPAWNPLLLLGCVVGLAAVAVQARRVLREDDLPSVRDDGGRRG